MSDTRLAMSDARLVTLTLPLADCIGVGQTLRALARANPNPASEAMKRVGEALVAAAKPQMEKP